jgi:beta-galactosidase beta subunit
MDRDRWFELSQNLCHPDMVFLSCFRQKQELCLKMGQDNCYTPFELNVHNPDCICYVAHAVRKVSLNKFGNSPSV